MVYCKAPNCTSGTRSEATSKDIRQRNISFHKFPLQKGKEELLKKWMKRISREDFVPTSSSRICSLHFNSDDFQTERIDKTERRKRKRGSERNRRILKEGAVPSVFSNYPSYLTKKSPKKRETTKKTSREARRQLFQESHDETVSNFLDSDKLTDLSDLERRLRTTGAVQGFEGIRKDDAILLCLVELNDPKIPCLAGSVVIHENFTFSLSEHGMLIPAAQYSSIVSGEKIELFSQVENLMAFLKNFVNGETASSPWLEMAVGCLERFENEREEEADPLVRKAAFFREQLILMEKEPSGRRFSPEAVVFAFSVNACSSQAYRTMLRHEMITLPSEVSLRKLKRKVGSAASAEDTDSYLKLRLSKLEEYEKWVVLLIDEIYVAKRAEYSGAQGKIYGLTEQTDTASTALSFMISSAAGKYRDIVGIYEMSKLDSEKLYAAFTEVMTRLDRIGFQVFVISTDNHSANRKFFKKLGGGNLKTCVENPVNGKSLFLILDPTHNFKNIYNNFHVRRSFMFPQIPGTSATTAHFGHLEDLFKCEYPKPVKMAHKLSDRVLHPTSVQKTSAQLACSVFHESTVNALRWYSENEGRPWAETAEFLDFVLGFWNVMNVKTPTVGQRKRDSSKNPVRSMTDTQITFLRQFGSYLEQWAGMCGGGRELTGLTKETFFANSHTCKALIEIAKFCLEELGFQYVLFGKFQSDPLEKRFGEYRQMAGGNYYISMKQLMESENKIRSVSLLRFSDCTVADLDKLDSEQGKDCYSMEIVSVYASEIQIHLVEERSTKLNGSDLNVIWYVAGAVARSELKLRKFCPSCQELLLSDPGETEAKLPYMTVEGQVSGNVKQFCEDINRGGLLAPSMLAFAACIKAWLVYEVIMKEESLKKSLLSKKPQELFVKTVMHLLWEDSDLEESAAAVVESLNCGSNQHECIRGIVRRFFNVIAKNLVKKLSGEERGKPSERKTMKLSGKYKCQ